MGVELVYAVFGIAVAFALAGAIFINRVSGGAVSVRSALAKPFKILLAPLYMLRVAVVFIFVAVGVALLLAAPYYLIYPVTTGYRYTIFPTYGTLRYIDTGCAQSVLTGIVTCYDASRYTLDKAVTKVDLIESPIVTYITQLMLRPDFVLFGIAFIIAGTILTAYFLSRSNTEAAKAAGTWVEKP